MHAQINEPRYQTNFGWDRTGELVVVQVPARERWKEVHGGKEERGERTGRAEGGASGPRSAVVHAQLRQPRHQCEVGAWDVADDLLSTQVPATASWVSEEVALGGGV